MILIVGTLLNIRLANQEIKSLLHFLPIFGEIGVKCRKKNFGDVIDCGREAFYILHEEEGFQNIESHLVAKCAFGLKDVVLNLGLQTALNTLIHIAETHNAGEVVILVGFGNLLGDGQKRTFSDRLLLAGESIVLAQLNDCSLNEVELIIDEREIYGELLGTLIPAYKLAVVAEIEEALHDVLLPGVDFAKFSLRFLFLFKKTALDHFVGVSTCEVDAGCEASLNTREVILLLFLKVAERSVDVHLRSHHEGGASAGFVN